MKRTNPIPNEEYETWFQEYKERLNAIISSTDVEKIKENVNGIHKILDQGVDLRLINNKASADLPGILFHKIADNKVLEPSFIKDNIPDSYINSFMFSLFKNLVETKALYDKNSGHYVNTIQLILKGLDEIQHSINQFPEIVQSFALEFFLTGKEIDFSPNSADLELLNKLSWKVKSDSALSKYDFFIFNTACKDMVVRLTLNLLKNLLKLANLPVNIISDLGNLPTSDKEVIILTVEHGNDDKINYTLGRNNYFLESFKKLLLAINGKQEEVTLLVGACHGNHAMNPRMWIEQENHKVNLSIYTLTDQVTSATHISEAYIKTFSALLNIPKEKADTVNFADIFIKNYQKQIYYQKQTSMRKLYKPMKFYLNNGKLYVDSDGTGFKEIDLIQKYNLCLEDISNIINSMKKYEKFGQAPSLSNEEVKDLNSAIITDLEYIKYLTHHGLDLTKVTSMKDYGINLLSEYQRTEYLYKILTYTSPTGFMRDLIPRLKYYFGCGVDLHAKDLNNNNIFQILPKLAARIINSEEKIKLFDIKDNDNNITYEDIYKFLTVKDKKVKGKKVKGKKDIDESKKTLDESKKTLIDHILNKATDNQKKNLISVLNVAFQLKDWIEKKLYCFKDWKEVVALDETDNLPQLQQEQGNNEHIAQQVSDDFQQDQNAQIMGISNINGMENMEFQG